MKIRNSKRAAIGLLFSEQSRCWWLCCVSSTWPNESRAYAPARVFTPLYQGLTRLGDKLSCPVRGVPRHYTRYTIQDIQFKKPNIYLRYFKISFNNCIIIIFYIFFILSLLLHRTYGDLEFNDNNFNNKFWEIYIFSNEKSLLLQFSRYTTPRSPKR